MYVKIGNFTNWVGPYQIANWLQLVGVSEKKCDQIGNWLSKTKVNDICEWIYSKKKRNLKIKIDRWDTWSLDSHLAFIILPLLQKLRETKQGSPGSLDEFSQTSCSHQSCFDFYAESDDVAWNSGHKRWIEILDEMIWTFQQLQPDYDWEEQYWDENVGEARKICGILIKGEYDHVGVQKHQERINNGLMLFGKYFQSLWD